MSDACDVYVESCDGDAVEMYQERFVTARKPHRCDECYETIPVAAKHWCMTFKFDGKFDAHRICSACWEIVHEFSVGETGGFMMALTWATLEEEWLAGAHLQPCLNRVSSVAAKELMVRKWLKVKGLSR